MSGFVLRRAALGDVAAIAAVSRRARQERMPYLPDLHTPEEDRAFFRGFVEGATVWVAEASGAVVGFVAFAAGWVDHLYVDPGWQGRGVGSALLDQAKAAAPQLQLWVFQKNAAARLFYERRGFRLVRETDGSGNEEQEPDALLEWRR